VSAVQGINGMQVQRSCRVLQIAWARYSYMGVEARYALGMALAPASMPVSQPVCSQPRDIQHRLEATDRRLSIHAKINATSPLSAGLPLQSVHIRRLLHG
jgi:hypothetical protein